MEITVHELPPIISVLLRDRSRPVPWSRESVDGMGLITEVSPGGVLNLAQFGPTAFEVMDVWSIGEPVGSYLDSLSSRANIPELLGDLDLLFEVTCEPFGDEVREEVRAWLLGRRGLTDWDLQCAERVFEAGDWGSMVEDLMVDWVVRWCLYPVWSSAGPRFARLAPLFLAFMFEECARDHMYLVERRQKLAEEGFLMHSG